MRIESTTGAARSAAMLAYLHRGLLVAAAVYLALLPTSRLTAARSIAFGIAAGLALIAVALSLSRRDQRIPSPGVAILVPLGAWSLCAAASVAWSMRPQYSLGEFKREVGWGLLTMLIFYVAARDRTAWRDLIATMLLAFTVMALAAAGLAASPAGWDPLQWHAGAGPWSTFLVLTAPLLLTLLAPAPAGFGNGPRSLLIGVVLLALLLIAARLSDNRMVWIALAVTFATASALGAIRWRATLTRARLRWLAPLLALFLVLGLLFADAARDRAKVYFPRDTSVAQTFTDDPRLALWELTTARIRERPWTGYGFGRLILETELHGALHDPYLSHAHNLFVSLWLQIGAFGLTAFVMLLAALGWRFARFLRARDDALALVGLLGLSMLFGFIVKNLTDDFLLRSSAKEFWAICAMLLGYGVRLERGGASTG